MSNRAFAAVPTLSRRSRFVITFAIILVVILLVGPRVVGLYTSYQWFGELGAQSVLTKQILSRLTIGVVVAVLIFALGFGGMWLAYRVRPAFVPAGPNDPIVRYRAAVTSRLKTFALLPTVIIAAMAGLVAQGSWDTVQLFLNRVPFGRTDPEFNKDIGFYVFTLPFIQLVLGYLFAGLVIAFAANAATHYVFGGIRLAGREGALSRGARVQLAAIAGVFLLVKAVAYWFDRYQLLYSERSTRFTGASYTDVTAVIPSRVILLAIALICAAAFFAGIVLRDLRVPALATVLMLFSSVVIGFAWPGAVQVFSVRPNQQVKETPYIERNLDATKQAFGLASMTTKDVAEGASRDNLTTLTSQDSASISNIRLLDPNVVSRTFQAQNGLTQYYKVPDSLTLDRYSVDGKLTNYLVAPVELDRSAIPQKGWINEHLNYTHGDGFITAPAGAVDSVINNTEAANGDSQGGGLPVFTQNGFGVKQPRIYYGELIGAGTNDYSIVGGSGSPRELDRKAGAVYAYAGKGGVEISNWFNRVAYAVKYGETNFILNREIGSGSKIIYDRDPAIGCKR